MKNGNFGYFIKNLGRRHRLSLRDDTDDEVWYMHISSVKLAGIFLAIVIIVFVASMILSAYTSLLDILPGYTGNKSREIMVENIARVDSLERELNDLMLYTNNIQLIMEGKTPVLRSSKLQIEDSLKVDKALVNPSEMDSVFRIQMEGKGRYGLSNTASTEARDKVQNAELLAPLRGNIVEQFSPRNKQYGTRIGVGSTQQIFATQAGTVILSLWTPDDGYLMQVQHSSNFISTYRHASQSLKTVGDRVEAGEVIGTVWNDGSDNSTSSFEFEIWYDGQPVDPQKYIEF